MSHSAYPSLSQPASNNKDGLGYSRHYAQKIRDLGKSSKESWIKRLWNHMFGANNKGQDGEFGDSENEDAVGDKSRTKDVERKRKGKNSSTRLPPIHVTNGPSVKPKTQPEKTVSSDTKRTRDFRAPEKSGGDTERTMTRESGSRSAPHITRQGGNVLHSIPSELSNSPYIPNKDKGNYKVVGKTKPSPYLSGKEKREPPKPDVFLKKPSHPYLSYAETWRPRHSRSQSVIQQEKKAKAMAERAMQAGKIFACNGPYPVDAYVRFSLRKRGWVEKFGAKANTARNGRSGRLQCEEDEDFEAIIDQDIPAPWEEENCLYAITSRIVRHYPARFIWGGARGINSSVFKSEVVTNHFAKARFFSSKVLIVTSLKELAWVNNSDHYSFFPRCHLLNEDAKDDAIDDFRLTAAMSLLRLVIKSYMRSSRRSRPTQVRRENTKYEEVQCSKDAEDQFKDNEPIFALPGEESILKRLPTTAESKTDEPDVKNSKDEAESSDPVVTSPDAEIRAESTNRMIDDEEVTPKDDCCEVVAGEEEEVVHKSNGLSDAEVDEENAVCATPVNDIYTSDTKVEFIMDKNKRVQPDLKPKAKTNVPSEVPVTAVEYAIQACNYFLHTKSHNDIDFRIRGLNRQEWDDLLKWFTHVTNGAKVPLTEGLLHQSDDVLRRMRALWPQYDIDGVRNIWIIKPGDKSKAIGIEFCEKLEDLMKFINNPLTAGTYVMQKYIERPLLIYKCKFDLRQWFLVTDWSPLTIWFYKTCYLRICSQEYSYDTMHQSVHLSNVAVQQNYINGKRDERLPENNFMTSDTFQEYLSEIGAGDKWEDVIYSGMKDAIINTLVATQDVTELKKNAFELYGADFMVAEDYRPYLLEINASPGMAPTSLSKARLCAEVIDDALKVVLDRKEDKNCKTGGFELIFRDANCPSGKVVDTKLLLEGQKIRRSDLHKYNLIDQKMKKKSEIKESNSPASPKHDTPPDESLAAAEKTFRSEVTSAPYESEAAESESEDKAAAPSSRQSPSRIKTKVPTSGRGSPRKSPSPTKSIGKERAKTDRRVTNLEKIYNADKKEKKVTSARK